MNFTDDPTRQPEHQRPSSVFLNEEAGRRYQLPRRVLTPPERLEVPMPAPGMTLDVAALFGRQAPLEIEIGFGKGRFLVSSAEAFPGVNYLGVEWARKYYVWTLKRFIRRTCENVKLINGNAAFLLSENLQPAIADVVHIYFPDPWPKLRHLRRRIYQPEFLNVVARVLKPGGLLRTATDHLPYGEAMAPLFQSHPAFTIELDEIRTTGEGFTNFEAKYLEQGRPIRHFRLRKTGEGLLAIDQTPPHGDPPASE